jgi:hypothetical protein
MSDPTALLALGSTATLGIGVTAIAALKGWHEWLELKRAEIDAPRRRRSPRGVELANLRERIKRLEAIANG